MVFLNTTGDVLAPRQQKAFKGYIRHGGGWVGIHSAADTEYDWPFYGRLLGAYFLSHPAVQPAVVDVTDRSHPSTRQLPARWTRTDEWYSFRSNPRGAVHILATLSGPRGWRRATAGSRPHSGDPSRLAERLADPPGCLAQREAASEQPLGEVDPLIGEPAVRRAGRIAAHVLGDPPG